MLLSSVPLRYSHALVHAKDLTTSFYATNNGLWKQIDVANSYILDQVNGSQDYKIMDNSAIIFSHSNVVSIEKDGMMYAEITGTTDAELLNKRLSLLKDFQTFEIKSIVLDSTRFNQFFPNKDVGLLSQMSEFSKLCQAEIIISSQVKHFDLTDVQTSRSVAVNHNNWFIYIIGPSDSAAAVEVGLRVLLDNASGLSVDSLALPLSTIPLLGGLNVNTFKSIARETGVNIYLPYLTPSLYNSSPKGMVPDLIYLTGLDSQVQLAIRSLLDIKNDQNFNVYYKSLVIPQVKKDEIILSKLKDLSAIIFKYGVFIQLSPLGDSDSTVHFQGTSSDLIQLAISDFQHLTSDILLTSIQLLAGLPPLLDHQLGEIKKTLKALKSATFDSQIQTLQIISSKTTLPSLIKNVVQANFIPRYKSLLGSEDLSLLIQTEMELNLTHHEFISGKKNGKIIKILSSTNGHSKIQFQSMNDYTFIVELTSEGLADFLLSFTNLRNEFPSEFKFFIPESFHRQIIGTGGSLIQSIMRKYNVFVKFSNQSDLGSVVQKRNLIRFDNVIIRCPFKNSSNIPLVQQELEHILFNNNEKNEILCTYVKLSRSQYRLFAYPKIQELEKKHQVYIKFPTSDFLEEFVIVKIQGVGKNSIAASKALVTELARTYEFKISVATHFLKVFNENNENFLEKIKVPFKVLYGYEILTVDHVMNEPANGTPHQSILLNYNPGNETYLEDASRHLTHFLRENEFMILDRGELSNNDLLINGSAASSQGHPQHLQFSQLTNTQVKVNNIYPSDHLLMPSNPYYFNSTPLNDKKLRISQVQKKQQYKGFKRSPF